MAIISQGRVTLPKGPIPSGTEGICVYCDFAFVTEGEEIGKPALAHLKLVLPSKETTEADEHKPDREPVKNPEPNIGYLPHPGWLVMCPRCGRETLFFPEKKI